MASQSALSRRRFTVPERRPLQPFSKTGLSAAGGNKARPPGNLYQFWIHENESWDSAFRMDNFLNGWNDAHPGVIDPILARAVFNSAMWGETDFFRSATGQTLHGISMDWADGLA